MHKGTKERMLLEFDRIQLLALRLEIESKLLDIKKAICANCFESAPDDPIGYYKKHFEKLNQSLTETYLDPVAEKLAVVEGKLRRETA
jgi:hypothetical protein